MSYIDPLADISLRCPHCKGTRLTSDNKRNHKCLDCLTRCTDDTALPAGIREKFLRLMPDAIIIWKANDRGRDYRMCLRCFLYVNDRYEPDTTLYTPAQMRRINQTPAEQRCNHMKPEKKEC